MLGQNHKGSSGLIYSTRPVTLVIVSFTHACSISLQVVCVLTTTSCFAPRGADDVVGVAKLCTALGVGHVVNNAYGVQSSRLCKLVSAVSSLLAPARSWGRGSSC